jgi:hypothetical protein
MVSRLNSLNGLHSVIYIRILNLKISPISSAIQKKQKKLYVKIIRDVINKLFCIYNYQL